jgi:diguanylate cyclase (GGDEF)-like protein
VETVRALRRVVCAERRRRPLIGLLIILCLCGRLEASGPAALPGFSEAPWPGEASFQSYGPEEDLMSMGITALAQDREGFLWVGSDLGLYRFDGQRFLNFGPKEGLPIGPDSRLWADPRGGVWTSSFAGVFRVSGLEVHPATGGNGLPKGPAFSLAWDGHDRAWVAMGVSGLFRESASGRFERVEGSDQPYVVASVPLHGGMLVLRQEGHAELWKEAGLAATWEAGDGVPSAVVAAIEDGEGRIWILSTHGLWWKAVGDTAFRPFDHPALAAGGDYRDLAADGRGGLWVATVRGLLHIRGTAWTYVTDREGMPTKSAAQVLVDREGSLWYASNGLFRQLGLGAWYNQTTREGLPTEIVWAVSRDTAGRLWAGTNMGLALMEGGRWRVVPGSEKTAILSMVALPNGGLVGAGRPRALLYAAPGTARAVTVPSPFQDEPASLQVYRVFRDRAGNAWIMGSRQICRMVPRSQTLEPAEILEAPEPAYLYNAYSSLQGRDGRFWFASRNGLAEYFQGRWRLWKKKDGLLEDRLYGLTEAADGSLLISYYDSLGVSRLRLEGDRLRVVRNYRMDRGELPTDSVFSIHRDHEDRIWLLTDVGAVLLKEDGFGAFGRAYGLQSQDMVINSFLADHDGALWFGDARSLAHFDSAVFPWNLPVPRPVFEDLRFGGRPAIPPKGKTLDVKPWDNALEVSLRFLSYSRARAFSFEVRIDGFDTAWRKETSPRLHYLALPPGPYTLRARAVVNGRAGPEAELPFRILPRWYQTWLFSLAVLAAVFAGLWVIVWWRQRRLLLVNQRLEALVRSRTEELATAYARLEESSVTDPLTKLFNRRYLTIALPEQLAAIARGLRTARTEKPSLSLDHPLVFLLIDIDHFKQVNDEFGHDAGDDVLREVGKLLKSVVRDTDSAVRWGGEEFLIVARYPGICDPATLAERIRAAAEAYLFRIAGGREIRRTVSIGFCVFPLGFALPMISWETAVVFADRALYAVKRSGRNGWIGLYEGPEFQRTVLDASVGRPDIADLVSRKILDVLSSRGSIPSESWS